MGLLLVFTVFSPTTYTFALLPINDLASSEICVSPQSQLFGGKGHEPGNTSSDPPYQRQGYSVASDGNTSDGKMERVFLSDVCCGGIYEQFFHHMEKKILFL